MSNFDVTSLTPDQGDILRAVAAGEASGNKVRLSREEATPLMEKFLINVTADAGMNDGRASAHLLETGRWAVAAPNLPGKTAPAVASPASPFGGAFAPAAVPTPGATASVAKKVVGAPSAPRTDIKVAPVGAAPALKPRAPGGRKPGSGSGVAPGGAWPFDSLAVGQGFFIPATADKPKPWASYSSLRQVGRDRYRVPVNGPDGKQLTEQVEMPARKSAKTGEIKPARVETRLKFDYPREFIVREADASAADGPGAWVIREK